MGLAGRRGLDPLVLVVDDEVSIRQALERALRLEGFAVSTAATFRAARGWAGGLRLLVDNLLDNAALHAPRWRAAPR